MAENPGIELIISDLQSAGYRITGPRKAVVEAVLATDGHFTGNELLAEVAGLDPTIGRATVFRTLEVLLAQRVIGRIQHPNGGQAYVVCPTGHHHHAICSSCGLVLDLPGCPLGEDAGAAIQAAGFLLESHRLEYYGICEACQTKGVR